MAQISNLPVSAKIVAPCANFLKRKGTAETGRTQKFPKKVISLRSSRLCGVFWLRLDRALPYRGIAFCGALALPVALKYFNGQPIPNRRYGRLKIYATSAERTRQL